MSDRIKRHPLVAFFVLAYALSWCGWILNAIYPSDIWPTPIFPFGPALAAVIITAVIGGKTDVRRLLSRLVRWRVQPVWYALALLVPVALTAMAVYLNVWMGAAAPSANQLGRWYTIIPAFPIVLLFDGPLGEELGWRGFALPMLLQGRSALSASLVLGVMGAGWHLPLYITKPSQLAYIPLVISAYVVFTWLFNNTQGSVLLAMLYHTSQNAFGGGFFSAMYSGTNATRLFWLLAAVYAVAAIALVIVSGPSRLSRTTGFLKSRNDRASRLLVR
jgi:membrane protease YdiL (CAAX protease family)